MFWVHLLLIPSFSLKVDDQLQKAQLASKYLQDQEKLKEIIRVCYGSGGIESFIPERCDGLTEQEADWSHGIHIQEAQSEQEVRQGYEHSKLTPSPNNDVLLLASFYLLNVP